MRAGSWRDDPMGRVFANVAWLLAGKGVGAVLSLVYLGLAVRTLGPDGFGQFTLVFGTAQAVSAFVSFQTWQIIVRYGVPHLEARRGAALARLVGVCAALDGAAALAGCAVSGVVVLALGPWFGWSAGLSRAALAYCVVTLLSVRSTPVGVLRLHGRFDVGAAADAVTPLVRFAGALVVVAAGASVRGFLVAWAVSEVATAAAYWGCMARVAPRSMAFPGVRAMRLAGRENPGLWHFAWITNVSVTLDGGGRHLVVLLVGLATGAAGAGQYRLAAQLSQALARVSEMFSRSLFAELARAHAREADFTRLLRRSTGLALAASLVVVLLLVVLGRPILGLVGGRVYAGTYALLVLLGLAAALDLAGVGLEPALTAMGRPGLAFRVRAAATLCLLATLALLLPGLGTLGAGVATLASSAFALALFGLTLWRLGAVRSGRVSGVGATPAGRTGRGGA